MTQSFESSAKLEAVVRDHSDATGWLSFDEFMALALYHPEWGYYTSGAQPWGAAGDYITAPMLGDWLGQAIARCLQPVWTQHPETVLLEAGAGLGHLQRDVRHHLNALPESQSLRIEVNQSLSPALPIGVMLANEVIDALPVRRFQREAKGWGELGVNTQVAPWAWQSRALSAEDRDYAWLEQQFAERPVGFMCERVADLPSAFAHWDASLAKGVMLFLDYGGTLDDCYPAGQMSGRLQAFEQHQTHDDVLARPGQQDLTSWVDFSHLTKVADAAGWALQGWTTQTHFLMRHVIAELPNQALDYSAQQALQTLMLPGEMGERVKVALYTKGLSKELEQSLILADYDFTYRLAS